MFDRCLLIILPAFLSAYTRHPRPRPQHAQCCLGCGLAATATAEQLQGNGEVFSAVHTHMMFFCMGDLTLFYRYLYIYLFIGCLTSKYGFDRDFFGCLTMTYGDINDK